MSYLVANTEDRFSHNKALIFPEEDGGHEVRSVAE